MVTTESSLLCTAKGVAIGVVTSGQDGFYAKQLLLTLEMNEKYPGLYEVITDKNGSLYLTPGMCDKAIRFLEDRIAEEGGGVFLPDIYSSGNPSGEYIRATLERLLRHGHL